MDSGKARQLFLKFAGAVAYVAVEKPDGSSSIGTAFHVGEGVFVTARHLVDGGVIREVATTEQTYIELEGEEAERTLTRLRAGDRDLPVHEVWAAKMTLERGPFFHPDPSVDLAVFKVASIDSRTPIVMLGGHLDDWLGQNDFVLEEVIVLGYPPIPYTLAPHIVAVRAEVNAQIDLRGNHHVHFVVSGTPRGGFSGAPAITEEGSGLGIVTSSLLTDGRPAELGFFAVLSVEPIYVCLAEHKLLPDCQAENWDGLWNTDTAHFLEAGSQSAYGGVIAGSVGVFDDGKRLGLEIWCRDREAHARAVSMAEQALVGVPFSRHDVHSTMARLSIEAHDGQTSTVIREVAQQIHGIFAAAGMIRAADAPP